MESPERIWVENLNGTYRHAINCSLTDPKGDAEDHRLMDEYILKDIADRCATEHSKIMIIKKIEEILQPLRAMKTYIVQDDVRNAFEETLKRGDNG